MKTAEVVNFKTIAYNKDKAIKWLADNHYIPIREEPRTKNFFKFRIKEKDPKKQFITSYITPYIFITYQ